ncbi:Na+/H+ antiporter subunit A [Serinibacter arcticus]|uniref:Na(+) H(+) antiporter subunit A / Na(+) H(+) antiporter subunit B n=1 Tax=Serinibacter arcticus TaxID=1655435 RepID=A0A4Z1EBE0_9MICO|nr:Na+/H+ antiporter subunit A [Serinibacter arcticus]TGO06731.1 Na(+) H(+) antiporter subunit A / Na(+) H(+) antiporter subunit B [Serinibacter arcticus]
MLQILLLHVAAAVIAPVLLNRFGRRMFAVLGLAPASAAVWALTKTGEVMAGNQVVETYTWVPELDLSITFRLDTLSWFMVLIVGTVGALVLAYCAWYFAAAASGKGRFGGVFVAFAGAMLGLVATDSTLMLYLFWELTTVFSYLLIGHYSDRKVSRRAAMQAIIVTTFGGLVMLGGIIVLGQVDGGSYSLHELVTATPEMTTLTSVAIICVLVGAVSKSALIPFHFWLPAAMAAPTPVSAYLHAAAMVKAGVYLVARLAPGFSTWASWEWPLLVLASGTMLIGGYRAMRQWDLKLVLAYGTVSQLGLLIMLVGQSDRAVALAGVAMIGSHAMFKATLFLTVGIVDAAAGTRDIHQLSNLRRSMPFLSVVAALAIASMIGIAPLAGYVAKEAALEGLVHDGSPRSIALLVVLVLGSILTVAYGLRFWWGAFAAKDGLEDTPTDREAWQMFISPTVLAVAGLAAGLVPALGERLLAPYAATYPEGEEGHLTLWGGFGLPLLLTVIILVGGAALFWWRGRDSGLQRRESFAFDAEDLYRRFMRRLDRGAGFTTSLTQRGSLPFYLAVILLVAVLAASTAMLTSENTFGPVRLWDSPAQLAVGIVIVVGAVGAARARRRLKAILLMGISGYGIALMYELHGAPDLAVTQVLVETVTLLVFVLVLRRLPAYFSNRPLADSRWLRAALGAAVGATVSLLALIAANSRTATPVSVNFPQEAYDYGYGRNIVNVTLVDIRAWDTMGEISVLLVAATGVASLVFLRVRTARVERASDLQGKKLGGIWTDGAAGDDNLVRLQVRGVAGPDGAATSSGSVTSTASTASGDGAASGDATADQPGALERWTDSAVGAMRNQRWLSAGATLAPQRRSVILEIATRLLFHTMVVFSLFLLFSGHNAPGGGFAGGLIAGIALVLRYLAGGRYELGEAAPVNAGLLLGSGLFLSAGAGVVPMFFGGTVLESAVIEFTAGPLGEIKFVTTLFFDIGVYLVVIGLVLDVLRTLGAEIDRQGEAEGYVAREIAHDEADLDDSGSVLAGAGYELEDPREPEPRADGSTTTGSSSTETEQGGPR